MQGRRIGEEEFDLIRGLLRDLRPLRMRVGAPGSDDVRMFHGLIAHERHLGHRHTVGEKIRAIARDRHGRAVRPVWFGGVDARGPRRVLGLGPRPTRGRNLQCLTNNTRFLIPGWVQVPNLASHMPGRVSRRIRADWQAKYGQPVHALETFVDGLRVKGMCYRASNLSEQR